MKPAHTVLRQMLLTEKAGALSANLNQYTFEVEPTATKHHIADAVSATYNVTVRRVNVVNVKPRPSRGMRGVPGYKSPFKKAVVTLKEGDKIEIA